MKNKIIFILVLTLLSILYNNIINGLKINKNNVTVLTKQVQNFDAIITVEQKRRGFIIACRDIIIKINKKINIKEAYIISKHVWDYSIMFDVDPREVLAIMTQESRFNRTIVSNKGAVGLMQLMPATAMIYSEALGMVYHSDMLINPEHNIKIAVSFIAHLSILYNNLNERLAYYNGGGYAVLYYRTKNKKLYKETKEFIDIVSRNYKNYCMVLAYNN